MIIHNLLDRFSAMLWTVNMIHIIWGYLFIVRGLPDVILFPGAFPFHHGIFQPETWGVILIVVSVVAFLGMLLESPMLSVLCVIPQQLIVMYAAMVFVKSIYLQDDLSMLLAAGWFVPVAIAHTIALLLMYPNQKRNRLLRKFDTIPE